ncbi:MULTISPECIES: phosphopantetheine-binding protein [Streptomyces]|uniref:Phosphopantetheine-binding protein n=1 Tax=Streptomyces doebereineriae TaxID=3075528 RepID=A0ABU2V9J5_9ACTN|nr:phosphopantetheine-binding protein [Streptomyces sp. DSM 41640]MDT0481884.1 phosphopantetheine-binding protein [Streptomyces sp. DSM 41640]
MKNLPWDTFTALVAQFLVRLTGDVERGTKLEEAGLDSLSLVELVAEIETRLDVEFPVEMLNWDTFATAGTLHAATVGLLDDEENSS